MLALIFSWEYPPRMVGELANYVKTLAGQLVKKDVQVYVVTYHDYLTGGHDDSDGVKTVRVTNPVKTHIGVLTWVLTLNQEVERAAADIYYAMDKRVNLIDVHDWHFIPAAVTLKKALNIPFVYSIDSLETHRSHGTNHPFNMAIKSIEWLGTYEAEKVLTKSEWMKTEVHKAYKVPPDKTRVIPPDSANWIPDILETYQSAIGAPDSE